MNAEDFLPRDRRQALGAFFAIVVVAIGVALWNDYRIDQAEHRISANSAKAADLAAANKRQDMLRAQLLEGLLHADAVACLRIEALKTQNRLEARRDFALLDRNLALAGITKTEALVRVAEAELARTLEQNRPREC